MVDARHETLQRTELLTPEPAEALGALLDIPWPVPDGDSLPPLWHWVYLLERRRQSELGPDGHPTTGIPAPPGPGRLRMFAGGRVTLRNPLRFGVLATRTTRVTGAQEKLGKSGPLTFVTVRHEVRQDGALAVVDEHDIVYREPGTPLTASVSVAPDAHGAPPVIHDKRLEFDVDPVVLFRFSALTYNAHRIHYDRPYAGTEGYPDLVIHGPLQALLMGELLRRSGRSMLSQVFAYRLLAPAFGSQRLVVTPTSDGPNQDSASAPTVGAQVNDASGRVLAVSTLRAAVEEIA